MASLSPSKTVIKQSWSLIRNCWRQNLIQMAQYLLIPPFVHVSILPAAYMRTLVFHATEACETWLSRLIFPFIIHDRADRIGINVTILLILWQRTCSMLFLVQAYYGSRCVALHCLWLQTSISLLGTEPAICGPNREYALPLYSGCGIFAVHVGRICPLFIDWFWVLVALEWLRDKLPACQLHSGLGDPGFLAASYYSVLLDCFTINCCYGLQEL